MVPRAPYSVLYCICTRKSVCAPSLLSCPLLSSLVLSCPLLSCTQRVVRTSPQPPASPLLRQADMAYGFAVHPESGPAEASTSGSFPHPRFDSFSDAAGADPTGSGWTPSRYDAIVSSLLLLSVGAVTVSTCPAPSACLTVLPPMQPTDRPRQRLSTH